MKTEKFNITGMSCAACQAAITKRVDKIEGVTSADVSLLGESMKVVYDEAVTNDGEIIAAVTGLGYGASLSSGESKAPGRDRSSASISAGDAMKKMKRRLISSVIILIPLMYLSMGYMLSLPLPQLFVGEKGMLLSAFTQLLLTIPVVIINGKFYVSGFKALKNRAPNMDSLVAIGSGASLIYGIFAIYRMIYGASYGFTEIVTHYGHMLYFESCAMILTLVTVGKYLESRSKAKTTDSVEKLVQLAPETAVVLRGGAEVTVPTESIVSGDIVVIKPGDRIPADGTVTSGSGYVDQSAITGESVPVRRSEGDEVISATVNKNGSFYFKATRVGNDTTLSQIIRLVEDAGNSKAPIARLADKVSEFFVPAVIAIALITAVIWLIVGYDFEFALNCAVSVLVISCPCALGLATPVAITVGTGKAAEYGILIKNAEALENLHKVDTVVLDKTGTVTSGHPEVTDIITSEESDARDFIRIAASAESASGHPLAESIVARAKSEDVELSRPDEFEVIEGRGIRAVVGGRTVYAGNAELASEQLEKTAIDHTIGEIYRLSDEGKTPLAFISDGALLGIIAVADTVRNSGASAISDFRALGLDTVLLTGDNKRTAEAVRKTVGIDRVISDVMPGDKEAYIRELQENGHHVLMIGDGINDAPALTRADVGMAIGAGTDIAIDSADIVLIKSSLSDAVTAISLSRSVMRNIKENLFWAFFYNVLGIPLAAGALYSSFGLLLSPMIGSAAMSLSSVCVVSNALRLRFFKSKYEKNEVNIKETKINEYKVEKCGMNVEKGEKEMERVIFIEGMMCAHCQSHVKNALEAVSGVESVNVELDNKRAIVKCGVEVEKEALCDAVKGAGYTVTGYKAE